LFEVGDDVINMLGADRDADKIRRNTGGKLFGIRKLLMRGAGRMNNQSFAVEDVGEVTCKLNVFNKFFGSVFSAFDAKTKNGALAFGQILLSEFIIGMRF